MTELAVQEPLRPERDGAQARVGLESNPGAGNRDWLIADLHLTDEGDPLTPRFLAWLERLPTDEGLWILGDLFEYWLGKPHLQSPGFAEVLAALERRSRAGGFTAIVPGNRDFLLDRAFEARTGVRILAPGVRLQRGDRPWLLLHGDELCTLDSGYQRLRWWLRSRGVRAMLACTPTAAKRALARKLRGASKRAVPSKPAERVRMQVSAAQAQLLSNRAEVLVCGHAHRFEERELDGAQRWLVLDAFGGGDHDVLLLNADGSSEWRASAKTV